MTEEDFAAMFVFAFNAPQQIHTAFRHIAIDNGQPYREMSAHMTAKRIYWLCRDSGMQWLENFLAVDQSGIEKLIELAAVGWFAIGTVQGAGAAMREIRQPPEPPKDADASGQESETPDYETQEVHDWTVQPVEGSA